MKGLNRISFIGCKNIADGLKENKSLKMLNLQGNPCGSLGGKYIADGLRYNHKLTSLDMRNCTLGNVGVSELIKAEDEKNEPVNLLLAGNNVGSCQCINCLRNPVDPNHPSLRVGLDQPLFALN